MKFIIIPKEAYDSVNANVLREKGLDNPRTIEDGAKVIMHVETYDELFPQIMTLSDEEEKTYPFPVYDQSDPEFQELIKVEEEPIQP